MFSAKQHDDLGTEGENAAVRYLSDLGYLIIYRNYRVGGLEIDIVAREPEGALVFAEVKSLRLQTDGMIPEDHLNPKKLRNMKTAARMFVAKHPKLVRENGWRVDALALTFYQNDCKINHIQNM